MRSKNRTLLWKIDGIEPSNPSYLFGTAHIRNKIAFKHVAFIFERIKECDAFATEFDLEEDQTALHAYLKLPNGQTLDKLISPKKYQKLAKALKKSFGINLDFFKTIQPLFLGNVIAERVMSTEMPVALDEHLWKLAEQEGKMLMGVETMEEQLNTLKALSLDYQIKNLLEIGRNPGKYRKSLERTVQLYEEWDPVKLFKSAKRSGGKMRKILLYNRNAVMAERIDNYVQQHSIFIAIGAGHLAGKKGVLNLLKQRGVKTTPVRLD